MKKNKGIYQNTIDSFKIIERGVKNE